MHIGCGSTAYSVGTVYGGKGHLYTPGVCPVLLATPRFASLAITLLALLARLTPERGLFATLGSAIRSLEVGRYGFETRRP